MRFSLPSLLCLGAVSLAAPNPASEPVLSLPPDSSLSARALEPRQAPPNNFNCVSAAHPVPVVFLHGLGARREFDLNFLQQDLQDRGYCTFSLTYGVVPIAPFNGGFAAIAKSSAEIALFIQQVRSQTGAQKVDIVGHSEGGFLSVYLPKFEAKGLVRKVVAIAPPVHGTTFAGTYNFAYIGGNVTRELVGLVLQLGGCAACDDLGPEGPAVVRLNTGQITQNGVQYTVIATKFDALVTPLETTRIDELGVNYELIQDTCPDDPVGHIGMAYDGNVWNMVRNALEDMPDRAFTCVKGTQP